MKTVNRSNIWVPSIFENLFFENRLDVPDNWETFSNPAVNIIEKLPNFVIELAAPGMQKENFSIEVEKDTLKVSAKSVSDEETASKENEETQFRRREFNYNEFTKSFKLPEKINTDDIEAEYTNGILSITVPKVEDKEELKKMIEIS